MGRRPPGKLTRRLAPSQIHEVTRWWQTLTPKERSSLGDERFPVEIVARFEEAGGDEDRETPDDFYEYVVAHELTLWPERTFHICTAHEEARAVVARGHIPASFV